MPKTVLASVGTLPACKTVAERRAELGAELGASHIVDGRRPPGAGGASHPLRSSPSLSSTSLPSAHHHLLPLSFPNMIYYLLPTPPVPLCLQITGCSSGLGRALARRLAAETDSDGYPRYAIYASARKHGSLKELEKEGIKTLQLDVTNKAGAGQAVEVQGRGCRSPLSLSACLIAGAASSSAAASVLGLGSPATVVCMPAGSIRPCSRALAPSHYQIPQPPTHPCTHPPTHPSTPEQKSVDAAVRQVIKEAGRIDVLINNAGELKWTLLVEVRQAGAAALTKSGSALEGSQAPQQQVVPPTPSPTPTPTYAHPRHAGLSRVGPLVEQPLAEVEEVMATNVLGVVRVTQVHTHGWLGPFTFPPNQAVAPQVMRQRISRPPPCDSCLPDDIHLLSQQPTRPWHHT